MFERLSRRTPRSGASTARDDCGDASAFRRRPFADLSPNDSRASTVELKRDAARPRAVPTRANDFVETPAALRRRVESLDAFETVMRRTDDATPVTSLGGQRETEEFDRRRALTPYMGGGKTRFDASVTPETLVTESVEPMRRMRDDAANAYADASTRFDSRGAVMEVLLWRDAARSAIHFTIGMTMLLFARLVPRSTVSGVSVTAYAAMAYLAYKYVWAVMFPRLSYGLELNDRAVGDLAQRCAICFNAWASKHHGVLAGRDNKGVFRTFLALYAVSALGHVMSAWAVATTLWVGAFIVPPFFHAYRYPLTKAYVGVHVFVSSRFNALSAPKRWIGGAAAGGVAFWCVNVTARFCLSFLALVAFRMFREAHLKELEAFENIVRSASRRMSRSFNEFAMVLSPAVRHRRR